MIKRRLDYQYRMYFSKWTGKAYAVFNSLRKEISICTVSVIYSLVFLSVPSYAQSDTITINKNLELDEIIISAQRSSVTYKDLSRVVATVDDSSIYFSPAESMNELLDFQSAVDIRQRSPLGIQADLSIRGGSFDQSMVLLNGMNITDPQTGHFSLNIPVDLMDISKVEVLKGPGSRVFGPNAFLGAVNIITNPADTNLIRGNFLGGENGFYRLGLSGNFSDGSMKSFISISKSESDGFAENTDFNQLNLFYHGIYHLNKFSRVYLQLGYKNKSFGAQSFYTPEYPDQFEQIETHFIGIGGSAGDKIKIKPVIYWRRHKDRFELFRESEAYYSKSGDYWIRSACDTAKYYEGIYEPWNYYSGHNYHLTDVLGGTTNIVYESSMGTTTIGFDLRNEHIVSNVLGEPMDKRVKVSDDEGAYYNKSYSRFILNNYFEQTIHINRWSASMGLLASMSKEFEKNNKFYPGFDLSYRMNSLFKLYSSYNRSVRLPTFTDMFYSGPDNIGNKNLKPETINSYEAGWKLNSFFLNGHIAFFYSEGEDIIAWVRKNSSNENEKWMTSNLTNVYTKGIELSLGSDLHFFDANTPLKRIDINYTYLGQEKGAGGYDSKYALNHLRNKLDFRLINKMFNHFYFTLNGSYNDRAGEYFNYNEENDEYDYNLSYEPYWLFDLKITWKPENWKIYFTLSNVFNKDYVVFGNLPVPGRWLKIGVMHTLFFD